MEEFEMLLLKELDKYLARRCRKISKAYRKKHHCKKLYVVPKKLQKVVRGVDGCIHI